MVCAALPFNGNSISAMLQAIRAQEPVYPKSMSPELKQLLQRLLVKDPARRIVLADIREHMWIKDTGAALLLGGGEGGPLEAFRLVNRQELDPTVVAEMRALGYDTADLLRELSAGTVSPRTGAYKMLRRRATIDEIDRWQSELAIGPKAEAGLPQLEGYAPARRVASGFGPAIGGADGSMRRVRAPAAANPTHPMKPLPRRRMVARLVARGARTG